MLVGDNIDGRRFMIFFNTSERRRRAWTNSLWAAVASLATMRTGGAKWYVLDLKTKRVIQCPTNKLRDVVQSKDWRAGMRECRALFEEAGEEMSTIDLALLETFFRNGDCYGWRTTLSDLKKKLESDLHGNSTPAKS